MFNFKPKNKFDKASKFGLLYSIIAFICMGYEILFSDEPRLYLIIMYSIVIGIGGLYIFIIEDKD